MSIFISLGKQKVRKAQYLPSKPMFDLSGEGSKPACQMDTGAGHSQFFAFLHV